MRIVLGVESIRQPLTGIGRYTLELLRGLHAHPKLSELICHGDKLWDDEDVRAWCVAQDAADDGSDFGMPVSRTRKLARSIVRKAPLAYDLWFAARKVRFLRDTQLCGGDVYHEPNYVLKPFKGPKVATVHDFSHERFPEFHPRERVRWLTKHLSRSIAAADCVITDSLFVRSELLERFPWAGDKVHAIPLGVGPAFRPREPTEISDVLNCYGLGYKRFVLSIATLEPRKNLVELLSGYLQLPQSIRGEFPLVLAGDSGWNSHHLQSLLRKAAKSGTVRWLGYVPEDHLTALYSAAVSFAFVSRYEGFGLPVVEAMASGTAVVASGDQSLAEAVGGAAEVVDATDVDSIVNGLYRVLTDQSLRHNLESKGLEHAVRFTWEKCVNSTVAVYERAMQ